jgi:alpha-beta hydrolase superfamily lysophospholipase
VNREQVTVGRMSKMGTEVFEVKLPSGHVQKGRAFKTESAKKNLLILTGMNEHSLRYKHLSEYLNTQGFNVYVLDAIGQGLNAPKAEDQQKWFKGAFDENVEAAFLEISALKKELPTSLMGHSMGSFMVQRYLELYPNSVEKVIECGTNGPALSKMAMAYRLSCVLVNKRNWDKPCPPLSKMGLGAYTKAIKHRKTDLDWLSYNEDNVKKYIADPYCGHEDTGGFWKEFLFGMKELYKKRWLQKISKEEEILIIGGEEDPVGERGKGPHRLEKMYKKLGVKNVTLVLYPNMRHEIHNEKDNDIVYRQISEFLLKK